MLDVAVDNDGGINLGHEQNRWRATLLVGGQEVFQTGFDYETPQQATGAIHASLVDSLRWAFNAHQAHTAGVFDQYAGQEDEEIGYEGTR